MLIRKHINYYLRLPLMAVMLLWAITLPGQEAEVYRYLVHGTCSTPISVPAESDGPFAVKQQGVQVFLDARTSSFLSLNPQHLSIPILRVYAFAASAQSKQPLSFPAANHPTSLAYYFLILVLPNAP